MCIAVSTNFGGLTYWALFYIISEAFWKDKLFIDKRIWIKKTPDIRTFSLNQAITDISI
jgi:hypothetical protein